MNSRSVKIDRHPGRSAQTIGVARALGTNPDLIHEPSVGVIGNTRTSTAPPNGSCSTKIVH